MKYHSIYSKIATGWSNWDINTTLMDKKIAVNNMLLDTLKTNPNDPKLLEALGVTNFLVRDLIAAEKYFKDAVQLQ